VIESFTPESQDILRQAQGQAGNDGHALTLPEHILLAICSSETEQGERMRKAGLQPERLREEIPRGVARLSGDSISPFSDSAQALIYESIHRAQDLNQAPDCRFLLKELMIVANKQEPPNIRRLLNHCDFPLRRLTDIASAEQDERRQNPRRRRWEAQLTPQAREVLKLAESEARELGHSHICSDHLLLALSASGGDAAQTLLKINLDTPRLRAATAKLHPMETAIPPVPLPMADETRQLLEAVSDRATETGQDCWNDVSLLNALLEEQRTLRVLAAENIDAHDVYLALDKVLGYDQLSSDDSKSNSQASEQETIESLTQRVEELSDRVRALEGRRDF